MTFVPLIIREFSVKVREMPFLIKIVESEAFNGLWMSCCSSDFVEFGPEAGFVKDVMATIALKQQHNVFVSSIDTRA
jgi:hypothetical protein